MSSNAPDQADQADQAESHSALASSNGALDEAVRREHGRNRQAEELVHRLARIVQGRSAEAPRDSQPQQENHTLAEDTETENASPPLPVPTWETWPTVTSAAQASFLGQEVGHTRPAPFDPNDPNDIQRRAERAIQEELEHAEILRRAERVVQAEIERRIHEAVRRPTHRVRPAFGIMDSGMSHSTARYRHMTISTRELQYFAMALEVERLQEEINLVRAGGGSTNDS